MAAFENRFYSSDSFGDIKIPAKCAIIRDAWNRLSWAEREMGGGGEERVFETRNYRGTISTFGGSSFSQSTRIG